jgi:MFS family permease
MTTAATQDTRRRSTVQLVKDLSEQASRLVRQEIELAKAEVAEKGKQAGIGAAALAAAALVGLLALGAFTAFFVLALDEAMPSWAAALVVALIWGLVAAGLALYGREKLREAGPPVPEKTVESVKEDIEWLKHPTN